jgi:2-polyprenyl-3-methyl-5-hydroxy-6-metoxy-1,4-benzoquinol methylase
MSDNISAAVQAQYEEHPYPVWDTLPEYPGSDIEQNVLFAGCGTGRDILSEARAFPKSTYLGIDLSRASLDFAKAKAASYGIGNVRFRHLNILDVAKIGEHFDFIKSTGVLHHMERPLDGLMSLKSVLKPNGAIKFSVYSKTARRLVLSLIELRKKLGLPATTEGVEQFRDIIKSFPAGHPGAAIMKSIDFQTVAGSRDLFFHPQEHNFTIPELIAMVEAAGLRILSWGPSNARNKFLSMGYTDPLDWRAWNEAEQKRPGLFANGMYSLVVSR